MSDQVLTDDEIREMARRCTEADMNLRGHPHEGYASCNNDRRRLVTEVQRLRKLLEIDEEDTELAIDTISEGTGIKLTIAQFNQLLLENHDVRFAILRNGVDDTEVRGELCSMVAEKLIRKKQPTYGDGEEYAKKFFEDLHKAAKAAGYAVDED